MKIDEMIQAHQDMIGRLTVLRDAPLASTDAALGLRDIVGKLASLSGNSEIHMIVSVDQGQGVSIDWEIRYTKPRTYATKTYKGKSLVDAHRALLGAEFGKGDDLEGAIKEIMQ